MSRSGYTEDWDDILALGRYRGQLASAIRGKRGQAFLRDLIDALEVMPEKRLIRHELKGATGVCAIGALGEKRGIDMTKLDPEDYNAVSDAFGVARQIAQEIVWENDENSWNNETPEARWIRMMAWARAQLKDG